MVETAYQLYEQLSQSGAPSLAMMDGIRTKMAPMNFQVNQEAAEFATEAHIHHMCTVANLIRACCFEGLAHDTAPGVRFAVLDEQCMSAVTSRIEARFYTALRRKGIAYITISHRPALETHHAKLLRLNGGGVGRWRTPSI